MKCIIVITIFLACLSIKLPAQPIKRDSALIKKIDSMFKEDQFWRKEYIKINKKERSGYTAETIQKNWGVADSLNEIKSKNILSKYGYPGYDLAGDASDKFWAIIQHCDDDVPFQEHVLALMKKQIAKNNAGKDKYAYLVDRVLVGRHQKQIYGTQIHIDPATHKATPLALKYPKTVNQLRKKMDLEPLEVYLKTFE